MSSLSDNEPVLPLKEYDPVPSLDSMHLELGIDMHKADYKLGNSLGGPSDIAERYFNYDGILVYIQSRTAPELAKGLLYNHPKNGKMRWVFFHKDLEWTTEIEVANDQVGTESYFVLLAQSAMWFIDHRLRVILDEMEEDQ